MNKCLTILVCTHDRAALLVKALDSLERARRPRALDVEVLVVANACRDTTPQLLDARVRSVQARAGLPLRWINEPQPGKSYALNRGIAALQSRWVAVVDDDHRVADDFLVEIERGIAEHPEAGMLCGRILPDWDGSEPAWVHDEGAYRIYPLPIPRQDFGPVSRSLDSEGPIPGGGNQIIRADLLHQLGPFSTDLGPKGHDLGGGEDTEYMLRALRSGARLQYVPAIVQHHHVDPDRLRLSYLVRKAYQRSAAAVAMSSPVRASHGTPRYLYRKLLTYAVAVLTAWSSHRRRFYLMRCAAALGEIAGHGRLRQRQNLGPTMRPTDHA